MLLGGGGAASAGTAGGLAGPGSPAAGPIRPVTSCASLVRMNFTGVPDAPGKVTSSAVVKDTVGTKTVSFCDVKGVASDPAAPADTTDAALALNYLKYMALIPNPQTASLSPRSSSPTPSSAS